MKSILALALAFVCVCSAYAQGEKVMKPEQKPLEFLTEDGITGAVKDTIVQHLKNNLSRQTIEFIFAGDKNGNDLIITEDDSAPFAATVKFYSLRQRNVIHWSAIYAEFNGKFYTSLKKGDFENFLKDYDFIGKTNRLDLFIAAYKKFALNNSAVHPAYIVTADYLKKNQEILIGLGKSSSKLPYKDIRPPKERDTENATEISFYVITPLLDKVTLEKVCISSDYFFQWKSKTF